MPLRKYQTLSDFDKRRVGTLHDWQAEDSDVKPDTPEFDDISTYPTALHEIVKMLVDKL